MSIINYHFVAMGTVAPEYLPAGEIWLDVGSRFSPQVFDHHGKGTKAWSATELVNQYPDRLLQQCQTQEHINLVLHHAPDLDAICASWLVEHLLKHKKLPQPDEVRNQLVQSVSEGDQGIFRGEPEYCFSIVFHRILLVEYPQADDLEKVKAGHQILDQIFAHLKNNEPLESVIHNMMSEKVQHLFIKARNAYHGDLEHGQILEIYLPTWPPFEERPFPPHPVEAPGSEGRWQKIDALYVDTPRSSLLLELARHDRSNSLQGQGFKLLATCRQMHVSQDNTLHRYTISVSPRSGVHLMGLGNQLEQAEQAYENKNHLPLLSGRKRVTLGAGRHGYNVVSPWYDGRGHHFTIVDSPSLEVEGRRICASHLPSDIFLATLCNYGKKQKEAFKNV